MVSPSGQEGHVIGLIRISELITLNLDVGLGTNWPWLENIKLEISRGRGM